jgi:ABC-type multidrug transport system permease subunit
MLEIIGPFCMAMLFYFCVYAVCDMYDERQRDAAWDKRYDAGMAARREEDGL